MIYATVNNQGQKIRFTEDSVPVIECDCGEKMEFQEGEPGFFCSDENHSIWSVSEVPVFRLDTANSGSDELLEGRKEDVLMDIYHYHEISELPKDWTLEEVTSREELPERLQGEWDRILANV